MKLAILAVLAFAAPAQAEIVTIGSKMPALGSTWVIENDRVVITTREHHGYKGSTRSRRRETKTVEVLAVEGEAITSAKIRWELDDAGPARSPLVGNTYVLTGGESLAVIRGRHPAPRDKAAAVTDRESRFGKPDPYKALVAGKRFAKDFPVDVDPAPLRDVFGDTIRKLTVVYRGSDGPNASFELDLAMQANTYTATFAGKLTVDDRTGEVLALELTGSAQKPGLQLTLQTSWARRETTSFAARAP